MRLRIIQLINNFYTDNTSHSSPETPLGKYCAFGNFDALEIGEPSCPFGENGEGSIWKHSARETVNNTNQNYSRYNILALILNEEKDDNFWEFVEKNSEKYPFLFLSMVRIIHPMVGIIHLNSNNEQSDTRKPFLLSGQINTINSSDNMIAYFSYDYSDIVILHAQKSYQSGIETILKMQNTFSGCFYTILAIKEELLQCENITSFEEEVNWKFYATVKDTDGKDFFLKEIEKEIGVVTSSNLLGEWDLLIQKKCIKFSTIFKLYKMGNLLTHSNEKFMRAFYNARTEFQL